MDEFTYRSLVKESELEPWLDHVVECFAEKGTPREYFERHWKTDPFKTLKGILIAIPTVTCNEPLENAHIASSIRVYSRQVFINGKRVCVGGIGEVSTKIKYRRKGLASVLMQKALDYMKEQNIELGALHTSNPQTAEFYKNKLNWIPVPLHFKTFTAALSTLLDVGLGSNNLTNHVFHVLPCQVSVEGQETSPNQQQQLWKSIIRLHTNSVKTLNGSFARSSPDSESNDFTYWNNWIMSEIKARKESFVVGITQSKDGEDTSLSSDLIAYGIFNVRPHPNNSAADGNKALLIHARDFIIRNDINEESSSRNLPFSCFLTLASQAVSLFTHCNNSNNSSSSSSSRSSSSRSSSSSSSDSTFQNVVLKVQTKLIEKDRVENYSKYCTGLKEESVVDNGYMYKLINPEEFLKARNLTFSPQSVSETVNNLFTHENPINHVFLEMDAY